MYSLCSLYLAISGPACCVCSPIISLRRCCLLLPFAKRQDLLWPLVFGLNQAWGCGHFAKQKPGCGDSVMNGSFHKPGAFNNFQVIPK